MELGSRWLGVFFKQLGIYTDYGRCLTVQLESCLLARAAWPLNSSVDRGPLPFGPGAPGEASLGGRFLPPRTLLGYLVTPTPLVSTSWDSSALSGKETATPALSWEVSGGPRLPGMGPCLPLSLSSLFFRMWVQVGVGTAGPS